MTALYAWTLGIPQSMEMTLVPNVRSFSSPYTRSTQVVDLLGERWRMSLVLPERRAHHGAAREAFIARLRGAANEVSLWHFRRPVPRGSMRGDLALSAAAAQGAASISVTGGASQANKTLLAGDLVGVDGMLLMVAQDATANGSGVITLQLANRLRKAALVDAAVTWNQPTANFRMLGDGVPVGYRPGATQLLQLDFLESWQ